MSKRELEALERQSVHLLRHPNDRAARKLLARKFRFGVAQAHARGIYWREKPRRG